MGDLLTESDSQDLQGPGNPRKHYQEIFAKMPDDVRAELAKKAQGLDLRALCYDPLPKVIHQLTQNPNLSPEHARIIAREHHNSVGLGHIASKAKFVNDQEVRRRLLKNKHTGPAIIQKLIGNRPLQQIYMSAIDRQVPEQTRTLARNLLKKSWNQRQADEKVALIVKTEGRCLSLLIGQALDGRSASLLCSRSGMSTMLIRNLLRWPSTPPPVLTVIARLPALSRDKSLKTLLQRHPNTPSSLKKL